MMHKNRSVSQHQFAMVPRAEIPRASFRMQKAYKTTFDAGYLIPFLCEEILPGDTFRVRMTAFARLATPIFPIMDNLHLETFFFFVPNRLTWDNWQRFMGEQDNPGDSTDYILPVVGSPAGGFAVGSLYDYFGLPTVGQVQVGESLTVQSLPFRAYNLIYNEWFRDQNLQSSVPTPTDDGPDTNTDYVLRRRGKRHDYFTGCLPWPQKSDTPVGVPLTGTAPVIALPAAHSTTSTAPMRLREAASGNLTPVSDRMLMVNTGIPTYSTTNPTFVSAGLSLFPDNLYADLSEATSVTINALRQSFQIQKLLERDARGGTRYTELVRAHFGVISPDARLQRPEFLGGGYAPIIVNPVAQTSATTVEGTDTPLGNLAAYGTSIARDHGFSQSFTEHGYVIGLMNIRADLTYQQGIRRHWNRSTRYDFYWPAFAMLGEQAVLQQEIYADGSALDNGVFGYQERWAEYRYSPSEITSLFRSTAAGTLDAWHLAQHFETAPLLNANFITEQPPLERILAVGEEANGAQFIFDSVIDMIVARPLPLYSVPGLIDHF